MSGNTDYYSRPYELVRGQIQTMSDRADSSIGIANETIGKLTTVAFQPESPLPAAPDIALDAQLDNDPRPPTPESFGEVDSFSVPSVTELSVPDLSADAIPVFSPSISSITLPPAPGPIDVSGKPIRPTLNDITIPAAPVLNQPDLGDLAQIVIPTFTFPELPTFDGVAPTIDFVAPSTLLQWEEAPYDSPSLETLRARVAEMLAGGTGIPAAVETALFDRARGREDMLGFKARQESFDAFAARGFSMPPGMLVEQVNAVIEDNQLKAGAINRDILAKSAEWEIENLRFAVQNGIALEGTLIGLFQQMAQRSFEAARHRVEAEITLFNARVGLFNAQQNSYQIAASVYKTRLEGALAELEVFKAQIQGQIAVGQLNEQTVKVFQAKLEAVRNQVEVYKATMQGVQVQSDVNRNIIEGYKADISGYAESLQAQKVLFDAYESAVKGETAKTAIIDAQARAFAATVQAYDSRSNIKVKNLQVKIEAMQAATSRYGALITAERERVGAQATVIQARTQAYSADVGRFSAEVNAATSRRESSWRHLEARLRNNLAFYDINIKEYDQKAARALQQTQISVEAIKGAGQMASQLAAGAMAAMHVSASMSGGASVQSSESFQTISNLS